MTKEQREKTKLALRRYGTRQWAACPANAGWRLAIERTIEYYQQEDPLRACCGCAIWSAVPRTTPSSGCTSAAAPTRRRRATF